MIRIWTANFLVLELAFAAERSRTVLAFSSWTTRYCRAGLRSRLAFGVAPLSPVPPAVGGRVGSR